MLNKDEPFYKSRIGTRIIAEGFGRRHEQIKHMIRKYKKEFEEISGLRMESSKAKTKPIEEYFLTLNQFTLLLSLQKTSEGMARMKCRAIKSSTIKDILEALSSFDFGESNLRYVYAATDSEGRIKIGISNNPEERIKNLNIGNPDNLSLVYVKEAEQEGYLDETNAHKICAKFNIRSEWFMPEALNLLKDEPPLLT